MWIYIEETDWALYTLATIGNSSELKLSSSGQPRNLSLFKSLFSQGTDLEKSLTHRLWRFARIRR